MSNVATLDNIKTLRATTDAPYKDCVAALNESENDLEKAGQWLKAKGKNENRTAVVNCGTIGEFQTVINDTALLVVVKTETDFVAINPEFVKATDKLAEELLFENKDALLNFKEKTWTFKEAVEVCSPIKFTCKDGERLAVYVHHNRTRASVVKFTVDTHDMFGNIAVDVNQSKAAYKVAMQVCSMKPTYVRREEMDQAVLNKIQSDALADALASGKPEAIAGKIAAGKVNNALKDIVLMEQAMFDNNKQTVEQFTKESGITVIQFTNVVV